MSSCPTATAAAAVLTAYEWVSTRSAELRGFVSLAVAARRLGFDSRTLRYRAEAKTIPAFRLPNGHWRVSIAWIEEQLAPIRPFRRKKTP